TWIEVSDVPSIVNQNFTRDYSTIKHATWYSYNNGYLVTYNENKLENHVIYDGNGKVLGTEREVERTVLPATSTTYLSTTYPDVKTYGKTFEVTTPSGTKSYVVYVNKKRVLFDRTGKYQKSPMYDEHMMEKENQMDNK